jgi:hypothetical protein
MRRRLKMRWVQVLDTSAGGAARLGDSTPLLAAAGSPSAGIEFTPAV